jgi:hypothetical protein
MNDLRKNLGVNDPALNSCSPLWERKLPIFCSTLAARHHGRPLRLLFFISWRACVFNPTEQTKDLKDKGKGKSSPDAKKT